MKILKSNTTRRKKKRMRRIATKLIVVKTKMKKIWRRIHRNSIRSRLKRKKNKMIKVQKRNVSTISTVYNSTKDLLKMFNRKVNTWILKLQYKILLH